MEDRSKRSARAVPDLPDDPLVEILSRVPAKSVCRFKCVSKTWRDLIADPGHRKKLRQAMQGLFAEARTGFSFIDLITVRSVPLDMDPSFFLAEMAGIKVSLLDSCNGLILFGRRQAQSPHYTVWNPTTKQRSVVPACGSGEQLTCVYLAFDPDVSSHFHLVQFQLPELYKEIVSLHVYSSETGTWSQNQIDEQKEQVQLKGWHHQFSLDIETTNHLHAFVNGFLHVVVGCSDDLQCILVVDVQGKARRMIDVPGTGYTFVCYLGQSQGHLHCMTQESVEGELSTWVLQDYDTQEWVLKNIVDLNYLDIFGETEMPEYMPEVRVVDIHQDCNVVLFLQRYYKLAAYDMDRKEASVIVKFKDLKDPWDFARYIPNFSESLDLTNKQKKCVLYV